MWVGYGSERRHEVLGWATRASGWDRSHQDGTEGIRKGCGAPGCEELGWDRRRHRSQEVTRRDTRWDMGHWNEI